MQASFDTIMLELQAANQNNNIMYSEVLPGPTGELNRLNTLPRPPVLCLGPSKNIAEKQQQAVASLGGIGVIVPINMFVQHIHNLPAFSAVLWWGNNDDAKNIAIALSELATEVHKPLIPLITDMPDTAHVLYERHLCVDTTAAGGNTALLAGENVY